MCHNPPEVPLSKGYPGRGVFCDLRFVTVRTRCTDNKFPRINMRTTPPGNTAQNHEPDTRVTAGFLI